MDVGFFEANHIARQTTFRGKPHAVLFDSTVALRGRLYAYPVPSSGEAVC